jgi:hypothetical protein
VPARILPVANQAPHKTEGLPRRLVIWQLKSEAKDRAIGRQFQSLSIVLPCAVCKEFVEISYFDFVFDISI